MEDLPVVSDTSLSVPACPLLTTGTALVVIGSYLSDTGAWHRAICIANRLIEARLYDWRKQGQITILDPYKADTIEGRELKEGEAYRIEGLPFSAYTDNEKEALREYIAAQVTAENLLAGLKSKAEAYRKAQAEQASELEAEQYPEKTAAERKHLAEVEKALNLWLKNMGIDARAEGDTVRVGTYRLQGE